MDRGFWLVVLVSLIGLVFGIILNHFLPLFYKNGQVPKGTFGWPLIGETITFLKPHPSNSIGHFLQDHCSRYGKVFKSHLFFSPTVVSCDHELNNYILQNEDKLFQCSYPKPVYDILGDISMLVTVGDIHKRFRNVAISLVTTIKSNPQFLNDIENTAIHVLDSWKFRDHVLFSEEAKKVLGLTPDDAHTVEILKDFLTFMKGLISLPLYIPGTPYAKALKARRRILSRVKAIIEERKRKRKGSNEVTTNDFLEILLDVDSLSEDEKVSFILDSLLGGYETTSTLMAIVVHFLGHSPTILEQLKLEHQKIRSLKEEDEHLNWDDYKEMKFTQNVIIEALRYGNVVKFLHRKALKDINFKGYLIPCGWKVLPVLSAVHLDPSLHSNALQFNPSRWEAQGDHQAYEKFVPFGGGLRRCPGYELAKVEIAFVLHHIVRKFRWRTEDGDIPVAYPYVEFPKGLPLKIEHCAI